MSEAIKYEEREPRLSEVVASNVRAWAGRRDISRAELARRTAIPEGTVSRKYRGIIAWSVDELDAIAKALDVPLVALLSIPEEGPAAKSSEPVWYIARDSNPEPAGYAPPKLRVIAGGGEESGESARPALRVA